MPYLVPLRDRFILNVLLSSCNFTGNLQDISKSGHSDMSTTHIALPFLRDSTMRSSILYTDPHFLHLKASILSPIICNRKGWRSPSLFLPLLLQLGQLITDIDYFLVPFLFVLVELRRKILS